MPNPTSKKQAIEWVRAGLADEYLKIAFGCSWPVLWCDPSGREEPVGGTCFFVNSGTRLFAMTASHVLEPRTDRRVCRLANSTIDPTTRLIDSNDNHDIATFEMSEVEVQRIDRCWHTAKEWPPALPEEGKGVFFGGYRGRDRQRLSDGSYEFGFAGALTTAADVNQDRIVANLDRVGEIEQRTLRPIDPGEDWGGASGGPVFTVVAGKVIDSWRLAGLLKVQWGSQDSFTFCSISMVGAEGSIH